MFTKILFFCILTSVTSCRTRTSPLLMPIQDVSSLKDDRTPVSDIKLTTKVVHTEAGGNFLVSMNLSKVVDKLLFRPFEEGPYPTEKICSMASLEFDLSKIDGWVVVRRVDGKPFDSVSFVVKTAIDLKNDNDQFFLFTDGSVALNLIQFSPYIYEVKANSAE